MKLRPYQTRVIHELREGVLAGHLRQILAMPTGSGKTVVAGEFARRAVERGKRVLFVVHLTQLVLQAVEHFERIGLRVGILQGENTCYSDTDDILVASIQTIASRSAPSWIDLVLIDECHVLYQAHVDLMGRWNALPFIGLSATPMAKGLGKHFDRLVRGPTVRELVDEGSLVPLRGYAPSEAMLAKILEDAPTANCQQGRDFKDRFLSEQLNRKELIGDVVETYKSRGEGRQALLFAVDVAHSKALADEFTANGVSAMHVDGYMPQGDSRGLVAAFKRGEFQILSSVVKLGVGFDYPNVSCAILARPTMSEMLFLQQIGRVLRPAEGKTDALVLDHAGNCARHGMPIDCVVHELDDGRKRSANKRKTTVSVYICTGCGYLMEPGQQTCPSCSIDPPTREADVQYLDGDLVAIGSAESGERIYTETDRRHWYYQARAWWREHCKSHNPDAAFYAFAEKFGYEPRGWTRRELPYTREVANWNKHYRIRKAKAWVKVQKAKSVDPNHCPACHSKNVEQLPGKGPHSGAIRCEDCGHYRWLARGAA